jgi:hypothetical protein
MEHPEQYYNRDMWPPENDRALMFRLASDVPVLQNTLIRIFVIGLSKVIVQNICIQLKLFISWWRVSCLNRGVVFTFGLSELWLHLLVYS